MLFTRVYERKKIFLVYHTLYHACLPTVNQSCAMPVLHRHIVFKHYSFQVYKNKFHTSHVVWILRGWYSKNWWKVNDTQCMLEEIERVMTNVIYVDHINYGTDPYVEALGLVSRLGK